jgi:hypothetical protein
MIRVSGADAAELFDIRLVLANCPAAALCGYSRPIFIVLSHVFMLNWQSAIYEQSDPERRIPSCRRSL